MSYGLVDELKKAHSVSQLCEVLDVQKSSYYYWQGHRQPTAHRLRQVTPGIGLLFHSDQGCQYTSHAYQDRLAELGIQASMSRRGNCWDNAVMERFFRRLKVEAISRDRYQTQDEMLWAVKKYIHFYNTKRLHSTIGSISPNQYEQIFLKQA